MSEASRLAYWSTHRDIYGIGRTRKRASSGAAPTGEAVAGAWFSRNRKNCTAVFPSARWRYRATSSGGHRQVILGREYRCVSLIRGRRNRVRDRPAIAPITPRVLNTISTALR